MGDVAAVLQAELQEPHLPGRHHQRHGAGEPGPAQLRVPRAPGHGDTVSVIKSLELQTNAHTKARNHGEGPY